MYTRPKRIYSDLKNLNYYIEGSDVYNSQLLLYLQDPNLDREEYTVKTPYRPDLIAEDFYGSVGYEPYVILNRVQLINVLICWEIVLGPSKTP